MRQAGLKAVPAGQAGCPPYGGRRESRRESPRSRDTRRPSYPKRGPRATSREATWELPSSAASLAPPRPPELGSAFRKDPRRSRAQSRSRSAVCPGGTSLSCPPAPSCPSRMSGNLPAGPAMCPREIREEGPCSGLEGRHGDITKQLRDGERRHRGRGVRGAPADGRRSARRAGLVGPRGSPDIPGNAPRGSPGPSCG